MQQRQLRLGDILDDYCPRERRLTNHAVVAMVGDDVKQTRCTTCDAEHEYKHARVPRQRRKGETQAALYSQVAAGAPKRVVHDQPMPEPDTMDIPVDEPVLEPEPSSETLIASNPNGDAPLPAPEDSPNDLDESSDEEAVHDDEGPIHRRLIRASLPRPEGQQPPARPIPEFTIRQPAGRNRFRPRHGRGGQGQHGHQFGGNRSNGNMGGARGGRPHGGRPGGGGAMNRRGPGGGGRKRSK